MWVINLYAMDVMADKPKVTQIYTWYLEYMGDYEDMTSPLDPI